ncbi:MAG TPA: cupin domain-containing protein [Bacteroidia bacterium]
MNTFKIAMGIVVRKENSEKYIWGNNCSSWILQDDEHLSIKQELMPPGTHEQKHFHEKADQFFYVLKGRATFYLNEEVFILHPNEGLSVLKNTKHYISNDGHDDLEFLVISQPNTTNDRVNV